MKEALKLALEALETSARNWPSDSIIEAITAIKEALAQPEQERCVGCEACIDTACGRDECPKGWPKAAQPEQEPVAWVHKGCLESIKDFDATIYANGGFDDAVPLYTTPPQRTWVGLTDEDIEMIVENKRAAHWEFVRQVEAKLKEKNTK
jgi:hypothetical protein